jgi:hypothetical protein
LPETGRRVGNTVGRVLQVIDPDETGGGGNWLRVKVMIDVEEPLCRGRKISFDGNSEVWASFKYERLPNYCYWCGRLSHTEGDCPTWLESQGTLKKEDQQFGAWLRASNDRLSRTVTVTVEGEEPSSHHATPKDPKSTGPDHVPDQPRAVEANLVPNHEASPPPNPAPSQITRSELFEIQLAEIDKEIGFNANQKTTLRQEVPSTVVVHVENTPRMEPMDETYYSMPPEPPFLY